MTTNNQINNALSGSTGTGTFVGANSSTLVTPILGSATATSVVFSPTTGGIIGTTTNDNTTAGDVGEYIFSQVLNSSPISLSTGVIANITSISLTAGDWNVYGNVLVTYNFGGGGGAACFGWISKTSATLPDDSLLVGPNLGAGLLFEYGGSVLPMRISIASTTTVYLSVLSDFSGGTSVASGIISARRCR